MRIRVLFHKTQAMRFTGHLDLFKTWERTLRRAGLALAYSQGFHPQPRLNLACALPPGFTSECELVDVWLESDQTVADIQAAIEPALPPGIRVISLTAVEARNPSLQNQVQAAEYRVTLLEPTTDLDLHLAEVTRAETLPRQRR